VKMVMVDVIDVCFCRPEQPWRYNVGKVRSTATASGTWQVVCSLCCSLIQERTRPAGDSNSLHIIHNPVFTLYSNPTPCVLHSDGGFYYSLLHVMPSKKKQVRHEHKTLHVPVYIHHV